MKVLIYWVSFWYSDSYECDWRSNQCHFIVFLFCSRSRCLVLWNIARGTNAFSAHDRVNLRYVRLCCPSFQLPHDRHNAFQAAVPKNVHRWWLEDSTVIHGTIVVVSCFLVGNWTVCLNSPWRINHTTHSAAVRTRARRVHAAVNPRVLDCLHASELVSATTLP